MEKSLGAANNSDDLGELDQAFGNFSEAFALIPEARHEYRETADNRGADELVRAYMGAGKGIFERDDPKNFSFLKSRISPPTSGDW